jgi:hypothetical protein
MSKHLAVVVVAVAAAAALVTGAADAADPGWGVQATPDPGGTNGTNILAGVACPSATNCVAVGSYFNGSGTGGGPIVARWNGRRWSIESTQPSGAELWAVSCSSAGACTAVGNNSAGFALAERWNGRRWVVQAPPAPSGAPGAMLTSVSCPSAADCTAIGSYPSANFQQSLTLAEQWNGKAWSIEPSPHPTQDTLLGVSCVSATACTAVGTVGPAPLAEKWNGTRWSVQSVPSPSGAAAAGLSDVACTGAAMCTAVGSYSAGGGLLNLAERSDGTHWAIQSLPTPSGARAGDIPVGLAAISCAAATACTAAGTYHTASSYRAQAVAWNGTRWVMQTTPSSTRSQTLAAVSCATAAACTAVGFSFHGSVFSPYATLAEHHS